MKQRIRLILAAFVLLGFTPFSSEGATVSEQPGDTVVTDNVLDLQHRKCDPSNPDLACSLGTGVLDPSLYVDFTDIVEANITALPGNGLVELAMTLNGAVPVSPNLPTLRYFWQFENGCVNGQPGLTDKDGVRILWDGAGFTANWYVITNCVPREVEAGAPLAVHFSSDRKTVGVQVDMCELVSRGGAPLEWHAGVRRLRFAHPQFSRTVAVDVAPDVFAFNPNPPPLVIHPEDFARWHGGCVEMDIKPGSFPNSINPKSEGRIPVAIFSNPSFDAPNRVDQTNLYFGRTGNEPSLDFCSGAEDVNGDGLLDLVCHFSTQLTGFQNGNNQGILKALTNDLTPIFLIARDSVRIVPAK